MPSSPSFNPSCPLGGSWYACGNGIKFVGCCAEDPCNDVGCSRGNLFPASFDASKYGTFSDQECSAGEWYTCRDNTPTFMGCCKTNPCSPSGCPSDDLAAAFLSSNPSTAQQFDPEPPLESATPSTSTTSPTSSTPPSSTSSHLPPNPGPSSDLGAIIGGSVGGGIILLVIIFLAFWYRRRRRSIARRTSSQMSQPPRWSSPKRTSELPANESEIQGLYRKGNVVHEAPDSTRVSVSTPAPRYSSQILYHEVGANEDPGGHEGNLSYQSSPMPPESPGLVSNEATPSSGTRLISPYTSPPRPQRVSDRFSRGAPSPSLEFDSDANAWTTPQVGLGVQNWDDETQQQGR